MRNQITVRLDPTQQQFFDRFAKMTCRTGPAILRWYVELLMHLGPADANQLLSVAPERVASVLRSAQATLVQPPGVKTAARARQDRNHA